MFVKSHTHLRLHFSRQLIMSLLATAPLYVIKGLMKLQNVLLALIPFSEILSICLFFLVLKQLFPCFFYAALFSADGSTQYLFLDLLLRDISF